MANSSTNPLLLSLKIILMSTGVVFLTPHLYSLISSFNFSDFFTSLSSWLRPPYLYFIINGIIITIAATSRLHHNLHQNHDPSSSSHNITTAAATSDTFSHHTTPLIADEPSYFPPPHHSEILHRVDYNTLPESGSNAPYESIFARDGDGDGDVVDEVRDDTTVPPLVSFKKRATPPSAAQPITVALPTVFPTRETVVEEVQAAVDQDVNMIRNGQLRSDTADEYNSNHDQEEVDTAVIGKSTLPPVAPLMRQESIEMFWSEMSEKPPVSARFAHQRRPTRVTTEGGSGKGLRKVAKSKKNETLEHTWKTITEGRHMPLTRHLKKSDTWETQARQSGQSRSDMSPPPSTMAKKSEMFKDRTNYSSIAPIKPSRPAPAPMPAAKPLRKEPSLGQDDLNRRVEAFINKFNEDMRLQRQQSQQQFLEMINRAA